MAQSGEGRHARRLRLTTAHSALALGVGAAILLASPALAQCSPELDAQSGTAPSRLSVVCNGTETDQQGDGSNQFVDLTVSGAIVTPFNVLGGVVLGSDNTVTVSNTGSINGFYGVYFQGFSSNAANNVVTIAAGSSVFADSQNGVYAYSNFNTIGNRFDINGQTNGVVLGAFGEVAQNAITIGATGSVVPFAPPAANPFIALGANGGIRSNTIMVAGLVDASSPGSIDPIGIDFLNAGSDALTDNRVTIAIGGAVTSDSDSIRLRTQDFNNEGSITPAGELFANSIEVRGAITSATGDGVEISNGGAAAVRQNGVTISGAVTANAGAGVRFAGATLSANTVTIAGGGRINGAVGVTFIGPNPGTPGVNNNSIDNSGTITAPTAASFGTGTGNRFINRASGVVNGDIRFQSAASELVLFAGSTLNGNAVGAGSTTTTLTGAGAAQIELQRFSGMGALVVNGGDWTATGSASGFQSASVSGGSLSVNGVFLTPISASNGGVLGGTGTVGALSLGAGGVLAPGNSIGTLNVTGPLAFAAASTLSVEVGGCPGLCSDRVIATGPVTISGGTVAVSPFGAIPAPIGRLPIVTGSSVTGTFSAVTATSDFSNVFLEYGPTDVFLNFRIDGLTGVSHATAALMGAYGQGLLTRAVLDQLAEDEEGTRNPASSGCAVFVFSDGSPSQRVEGEPRKEGAVTKAWARGFGAAGSIDPALPVAGVNYHLGGFAVGVEKSGGGLSVGAGVGAMTTDMDQSGHDVDLETAQFMLYGGYEHGPFDIGLALAGGRHSVESGRSVVFGATSGVARAAYSGWTYGAALEAGYGFDLGKVQLRPYGGVDYTRTEFEGFQEAGSPLGDLAVAARSEDALRISAGFRATSGKLLFGALRPAMRVAYAREIIEGGDFSAAFVGSPASAFTAKGAEFGRDRLLVGAGVAIRAGKRGALGVSYDGEFSKSDAAHALSARFNYAF